MIEVEKLAKLNKFDYLLIESTGISEPIPVAQTFSFVNEDDGIDLSKFSFIDCMVTVVDCFNFFKDFSSDEQLVDRDLTDMEGDHRTIVNLLTDQIEFANVILLNKTDLVSNDKLELIEAMIHKLNPVAKIIHSSYGKINPKEIIGTGLFNYEEAEASAGWIRELEGEHTPETEEYGISSFVFRSPIPFHPDRFWKYVNEQFPSTIIRSKGLFWLASRPKQAINWSQAGGSLSAEGAGVWWDSMPFSERIKFPSFLENKEIIENRWTKDFGDRINELVFIGQDMDEDLIRSQLKKCQCSDRELESFKNDNFPTHDEWPINSI